MDQVVGGALLRREEVCNFVMHENYNHKLPTELKEEIEFQVVHEPSTPLSRAVACLV